jgi:branched-chain amino acid transport system ATP-binding protein
MNQNNEQKNEQKSQHININALNSDSASSKKMRVLGKDAILKISNLEVSYGGIKAVKKADLEVKHGELVCVIGSNGAGKTTIMKSITGIQSIAAGDIEYMGKSIKNAQSYDLLKQGLVMVPEGRGVFTRMTITENLQMGAYIRNDKEKIAHNIEEIFEFFPRLRERATQLAGTLSGGEQQMLAMGRAYMSQPKLLLLDEPSMGLSPIMVEKVFEFIRIISSQGIPILLVEQNAKYALEISDKAYVMDSGNIIMSGDAKLMLDDPKVKAAYLGE